jgi:hypothetical protein
VWLFGVIFPCVVLGFALDAGNWLDLMSGPATARGTVTASNSIGEQGVDSHGSRYSYTSYHLTIGRLTFSSDRDSMADVFKRATTGDCAVVTYGAQSNELTGVEPCPTQ